MALSVVNAFRASKIPPPVPLISRINKNAFFIPFIAKPPPHQPLILHFSTIRNTTPLTPKIPNFTSIRRINTEPSKHDLQYHLKNAPNFRSKLVIRAKWALIKNNRRFNTDELGAFFSWIMWGHILWIILGTTTFISLMVWASSKVKSDKSLANWVATFIAKQTGLEVKFEEAIVPDWKSRSIKLRKVVLIRSSSPESGDNVTHFNLTIDAINVKLSMLQYLSGRGIIEELEARGIRGSVDRRHLKFDPNYIATDHRKVAKWGDFHWKNVRIEDLLVTVFQPNYHRHLPPVPPFEISLFSCELPRLRKQWLLYDFLNAQSISGSFDNALFTLHSKQLPTITQGEQTTPTNHKIQRLRVDDVDIKHLNRGVKGMFGWIESGTCDFIADFLMPGDEKTKVPLKTKAIDLIKAWKMQFKSIRDNQAQAEPLELQKLEDAQKIISIDLHAQFNNPRAKAPLYSPNLNYLNNAIIHPIVAYINSRDTYIPVHCYVAKRLADFDGSWTLYDSGLITDLSAELYRAFAQNIKDDENRSIRMKKVGFYSLQFMAQLFLLTLGAVA